MTGTAPPAVPAPTSARGQRPSSTVGARGRARIDWIAVGALSLLALFLQPAIHAAYRADDTWNSVVRGKLTLTDESLPAHLWWTAENFLRTSGRPNVLGTTEGLFAAWLFDPHVIAYHVFILALTLIGAGVLYALARELGLSRGGGLLVVTLVAGAMQFRSYHDAVLGYSGAIQIVLILTLASLLFFVRGLRRDDRRLLALSFMLFLPCPLLYEGAYTLVAVHLGVALLERRGRAALRVSLPFLTLGGTFVVISLVARALAPSVASGYEVGSSPLVALKTYVIQLFTPIPASNVFFSGDAGYFQPLGADPTAAELLAGSWRGLAVFVIVLIGSLRLAGRKGSKLPPAHTLWGLATVGALLWSTSVLVVSAAPKYQVELNAGNGHLPALIQVFGWALLTTAALLALLRSASGRSTAAVRLVALAAALSLGFAAGVVGFNNMRVVALETPIVETRSLLEHAASEGAFADLPPDASLIFSTRDLGWPTGSWAQVPEGIESMLIQRSGRRLDGRIIAPDHRFDCPRSDSFPPADCEPLALAAAWARVRARPGGGTVVVAPLPEDPTRTAVLAPARRIRVFVEGDESDVPPPLLIGRSTRDRPWRSNGLSWRRVDRGDGWALYDARIAGRSLPVASSLDDANGKIDFTAPGSPDQIVRIFGTKRLLP